MAEIPIVLLAAGHSERMGRVKQLLPWGNSSLIEHQIQTLRKTGHPVYVVLGYGIEQVLPLVKQTGAGFVVNPDWEKGMGGSIATGVKQVMDSHPRAKGVLIALVDQPLVPSGHYLHMIRSFKPGNEVIMASRSGSIQAGVPALFDAAYFPELVTLQGQRGAKKIIQSHRKHVLFMKCPEAAEDLDTPEDYQRLLALYNQGRDY